MYNSIKIRLTVSYLLPCLGGYLLVDTSYENRYAEFVSKLDRLGIKVSQIKYLFLTHHHDDHSGFAEELRNTQRGITLITHEKSRGALQSGTPDPGDYPLNKRVGFFVAIFNHLGKEKQDWSFPPVQVQESDYIVEGDDFGFLPSIGINGAILHTPGHTHDSMTILLADGSAFVGDLAMDLLGFCGCHFRPIYVTNLDEVYQSWVKIIRHGADSSARVMQRNRSAPRNSFRR